MEPEGPERVFSEERVRRAGLVNLAAGFLTPLLGLLVGAFACWLLHGTVAEPLAVLTGVALGLATAAVAADFLSLGWYNRRWRRQLIDKLRGLGELGFVPDDPTVYFVGLAHPARISWRRWETDDDIGFLAVGFDSLSYRGDRFSFEVPFEAVESVELVPVGYGLPAGIKRIRVRFESGEPFDEVLLCCREGDRLSSGNRVTHTLYEALRQRWERRAWPRRAVVEAAAQEHLLHDPR